MSKVTTRKLTKEELERIDRGELTYEEALSSKEPIEREVDTKELTTESYSYWKHEGLSDSDIRKKYGVTLGEFEQFQSELDAKKAKLKKARDNAQRKKENEQFTKEWYLKKKDESKTDTQIIKETEGLHPVKLNNLKKEWGLIGVRVTTNEANANDDKTKEVHKSSVIAKVKYDEQVEENKKLKQEIMNLKMAPVEVDGTKVKELEENNQKLGGEVSSLIDKLNNKEDYIQELEKKNENCINQVIEQQEEIQRLEKKNYDKALELSDVSVTLHERNETIYKLELEIQRLKTEIQEVVEPVKDITQERDDLVSQIVAENNALKQLVKVYMQ